MQTLTSTAPARTPTVVLGAAVLPARLLAAVAGGLALNLAFPPAGLWPAASAGVALFVLSLRGVRARVGALLGLVCGLAFFLPLLHWSGTYVGAAPWVALSTAEAGFLALLGAFAPSLLRLPAGSLWFAAAWVGVEGLRARVPFGGFPWGALAFAQDNAPTLGLAALGGVPLVSFVVALAWALLASALVRRSPNRRRSSGPARWGAALLAVAVSLLGALVPRPTAGPKVEVAVVQGNVPRLGLDFNAQRAAVLEDHLQATQQLAAKVRAGAAAQPALVVWPENSSDIDPFADPVAAGQISAVTDAIGAPVLVGAVVDGPGPYLSNTAIVWQPGRGPTQRYVKRHPAPFGEYIPMRGFFRLLSPKVDLVRRDFAPGHGVTALRMGPAAVAPVICFEVLYDGLVRSAVLAGGTIIAVQTNSATFGRSAESAQQLAVARLRAVEHARTVLAASTVGISAIISPDGTVLTRSKIFTQQVLEARVPLRSELTVADRLGGWPEALLSALGCLGVVLAGTRWMRERRGAGRRGVGRREGWRRG